MILVLLKTLKGTWKSHKTRDPNPFEVIYMETQGELLHLLKAADCIINTVHNQSGCS